MIVNVEQVVTRAKLRLRLMETSEHDSTLMKFIEEGARGLNATSTYKIQCKNIDIECHKSKLPDCYETLICFQINGCSGCCTPQVNTVPPTPIVCTCPEIFYYDKAAMINCGDNCGWYNNFFYIQDGFMYFPSSMTADTVKVWYYGFNVDEDGLMLIDEEMERGLSAYAAFQFAVSYPEQYTPEQRSTWNREWIAQKNYVNGKKIIREFKLQKPNM
jgi:hypothetical protein